MTDISSLLETATAAYSRGDFDSAKLRLDEIIEACPDRPEGLGARYLRARGHEDGYFGSLDLEAALSDYAFLKERADFYGSDGVLGYARTLFAMDGAGNREEIIKCCMEAVAQDKNIKAMMLLGLVYENVERNVRLAHRWYLRAYVSGLPWGMRYYARSQWKLGRYIRGGAGHMIATVTSPIMVALTGSRSAFK